jgi:hypothetical protein
MSMHTTHDIVVHLGCFLNVDLFSRGCFFVRVCLHTDTAEPPPNSTSSGSSSSTQPTLTRTHALPYAHKADPYSLGTMVGQTALDPVELTALAQPFVEGSHYHSRMFVVRFKDEVVDLNEVVQFQHISAPPAALSGNLLAGQTLVYVMNHYHTLTSEIKFSLAAAQPLQSSF